MKRYALLIICAAALLGGCTAAEKQQASEVAIEQVSKASDLRDAEDFLVDVKKRMAKEVSEDYFASAEWKAFVDSFWNGYNEGQQQMKSPELKDLSTIVY